MLQGAEADARSDIFSFGCLLYEMVTGRRAFDGKSQISVISAILEKDPVPISSLRPLAPRPLERAVRTCLDKDPDRRFQSAQDIALQLGWVSEPEAGTAQSKARWPRLLAAIALPLLLLLLLTDVYWNQRSQPALPMLRVSVEPENLVFDSIGDNSGPPALSPNGALLVFRAHPSGSTSPMLWLRHMDTGALQQLDGTENAAFPFWSPDSRNVAFFAGGKLVRMQVAGEHGV